MNFSILPEVIVKNITLYLYPNETKTLITINKYINNLSENNQGIWYLKLKYLLKDNFIDKKQTIWKDDFQSAWDKYNKISANTMEIMHGNDTNYWIKNKNDNTSPFGKILVCKAVCWFDIKVHVALFPGKYIAIWKLRSVTDRHKDPLTIEARTYNGNSELISKTSWYTKSYIGKGWKKIKLEFYVNGQQNKKNIVTHHIWRHSQFWSSEINIDYLHLDKLSS